MNVGNNHLAKLRPKTTTKIQYNIKEMQKHKPRTNPEEINDFRKM